MIEIKKNSNETEEQFLWRIGQLIDSGKIENWKSINDIVNRELLGDDETIYRTESAWRKKYQIAKKFYNGLFSKMEEDDYQKELKAIQKNIEKERVKLRDERNEYKKIIREEARKESYRDLIIRTIGEYQSKPLKYDENKRFNGVIKTDNDLICSFTDIHTGIKISNFVNEFDENVLKDRMNKYLDKIFEVYWRHTSENCYIILSELLSGIIHNNLRIENNQNLIEQFLTIMDYLSEFLTELSYRFMTVHVVVCEGNHSRIVAKKDDSLTGENMDMLAIPFLSAKLQNFDNIVFHNDNIEASIALFNVRGNTIVATHGDKDNPDNVVQKLTLFLKTRPDIIYLGHRHTNALSTIYDVKVIESGCMSGSDNFCMDKRLRNKPEQTISVITKNGLDCLYNVVLN